MEDEYGSQGNLRHHEGAERRAWETVSPSERAAQAHLATLVAENEPGREHGENGGGGERNCDDQLRSIAMDLDLH